MITKENVNEVVTMMDLHELMQRANDFHRDYYLVKMAVRNAYQCAKHNRKPSIVPLSGRWLKKHRLTGSAFYGNSSKYFGKISVVCGVIDLYGYLMQRGVLFEISNK